jgi:hypothetical protein
MKKGIVLLLSLTVALLCYVNLNDATARATMHLEEDVSREQAKEILRQEDEQEEKVVALFFRKSVSADIEADIFEICGEARLLTWSMDTLASDDVRGVLISDSLATKLFKSEEVKGNEIELEGNIYTIRGVYPAKDRQIIRLNQDEKLLFNQVRVAGKEHEMAATTLQEFAMRHGVQGVILNWVEYVGLVKGLLLLAFAMIAVIIWFALRNVIAILPWQLIQKPFVRKAILIAYAGVVVVLLGSQVHIPIEMIPAKWSDFAYWSEWFAIVSKNVSNVFLLEKIGYEQQFLSFGLWSMVGSVGVIFMAVLIIKDIGYYRRQEKNRKTH